MTTSPVDRIDCAVIGAGVVGLAVARALALAGREVVVLEAGDAVGTGISSRNSEVVHAGMYYPEGSLKARLCVRGNRLLRAYAKDHGVPFRMVGKLIVAADAGEEAKLDAILARGRANGVDSLIKVSAREARAMEPELDCVAALYSPATGIIDSHGLMLALQGDAEAKGAAIAFRSPVTAGQVGDSGVLLHVGGELPSQLLARTVVVAAGLAACPVARALGLPNVPAERLCKGSYFALTGRMPFRRLVYPVPVSAGLGIHYTVDMAGRGRFGPDVEWVEAEDYAVDPTRAEAFAAAIRRYWPRLDAGRLEPAHAGIRPKICGPGDPAADFVIHGPRDHGMPGVVALYGIESPGLTACLAIAEHVGDLAR